jgi:hypothetical protein
MTSRMSDGAAPRLERSCGSAAADWMRIAPSSSGFERVEAFFSGHGFDPHRHDAYAIGFTLHGVQSFRYRGAPRHSLPGQVFVLHPDEPMTAMPAPAPAFATASPMSSPASSATPWVGRAARFRSCARRCRATDPSLPRSCRRSMISTCCWRICTAPRSSSVSRTPSPWPTRRRRRESLLHVTGLRSGGRATSSTPMSRKGSSRRSSKRSLG